MGIGRVVGLAPSNVKRTGRFVLAAGGRAGAREAAHDTDTDTDTDRQTDRQRGSYTLTLSVSPRARKKDMSSGSARLNSRNAPILPLPSVVGREGFPPYAPLPMGGPNSANSSSFHSDPSPADNQIHHHNNHNHNHLDLDLGPNNYPINPIGTYWY